MIMLTYAEQLYVLTKELEQRPMRMIFKSTGQKVITLPPVRYYKQGIFIKCLFVTGNILSKEILISDLVKTKLNTFES